MQVLHLTLKESGSIADIKRDFALYQGSYHNVLLNIVVPQTLLLEQIEREGTQVNNSVSIGMIGIDYTGKQVKSKRFLLAFVKRFTKDGIDYSLFQRRLPADFTLYSGDFNLVTNITNIVTDETSSRIERVTTSQSAAFTVLRSTHLDEEVPLEPSELEWLASRVTEAETTANAADAKSDIAMTTANQANTTANTAIEIANQATTQSLQALEISQSAEAKAQSVVDRADAGEFIGKEGNKGNTGPPGPAGGKGDTGATGPTPNITISASNLPPGSNPTVNKSGSPETPHIAFGIPAGGIGPQGIPGVGTPAGMVTYQFTASEWLPNASGYTLKITPAIHKGGATNTVFIQVAQFVTGTNSLSRLFDADLAEVDGTVILNSDSPYNGVLFIGGGFAQTEDAAARAEIAQMQDALENIQVTIGMI